MAAVLSTLVRQLGSVVNSSDTVLRYLHSFAVLESRLVGNDTADSHVQRLDNIDEWFADFKQGENKFIHQLPMRSTVPTSLDLRRV